VKSSLLCPPRPPPAETSGESDEDFAQLGGSCDGPDSDSCANGIWACGSGGAVECAGDDNKPELCDGKDNNCDGKTDEGFTLSQGTVTLSVGSACGFGPCSGGSVECSADMSTARCSTSGQATSEKCNGVDDDCDAATDEDYTYNQLGVALFPGSSCGLGHCVGGTVICSSETTATCSTQSQAQAEVCNSLDDDCDGTTDDDLLCASSSPTTGRMGSSVVPTRMPALARASMAFRRCATAGLCRLQRRGGRLAVRLRHDGAEERVHDGLWRRDRDRARGLRRRR